MTVSAEPVVSIVIPTASHRELLRRTLLSLARQTYPADRFQVVVVDTGSIDGTRQMVARLAIPYPVRYVRPMPRGFAAASNVGVRAASANLLIFLASGMVLGREFVAAHVEAHGRPRRVVLGPVIPTADKDAPVEATPGLWARARARFGVFNMSVARMYVEEAGMFDEALRDEGWAGMELRDRLRAIGLSMVNEPRAWGYRYVPPVVPADLDLLRERARRRGRAGVAYYRKQPTWQVRGRLGLLPPIFWLDRLLFPREWPDAPWFRRLIARSEVRRLAWLVRPWLRLTLHHAYVEGLREGLRNPGDGRPEPGQVQREF